MRRGNLKVVLDGGQQLLFDVVKDPAERSDLAAVHPGVVAAFKQQIEAWEKDVNDEAAALKGKRP
jgi:hypothetical protein